MTQEITPRSQTLAILRVECEDDSSLLLHQVEYCSEEYVCPAQRVAKGGTWNTLQGMDCTTTRGTTHIGSTIK